MPTFWSRKPPTRSKVPARERFTQRGRFMVRTGKAPKRAILFRTDAPFEKITIDFTSGGKLEFLGKGQQVVVDGIHPETLQPYTWTGGEPWTVKRDELPMISVTEAVELMEAAAELLIRDFGFVRTAERAQEAPFITLVAEPVSDHRKQAYGQKALADIAAEVAAVVEKGTARTTPPTPQASRSAAWLQAAAWATAKRTRGWWRPARKDGASRSTARLRARRGHPGTASAMA